MSSGEVPRERWSEETEETNVLRERRRRNGRGVLSVFPMGLCSRPFGSLTAFMSLEFVNYPCNLGIHFLFQLINLAQVDFWYYQPNRSLLKHLISVKLKFLCSWVCHSYLNIQLKICQKKLKVICCKRPLIRK